MIWMKYVKTLGLFHIFFKIYPLINFLYLRYCHKLNGSSVLLLRNICSSLLNFLKRTLKPGPVPLSGPFLVRPALVECCNIDLNEFPLITDGLDSPFCLVGE
jgi:hypothetical protein